MEGEQVLPDDEFRVRGALKRRCLLHPDGAGQERNMDTTMKGGTYDDVLEENSDLHFGLLTKASLSSKSVFFRRAQSRDPISCVGGRGL